MHRFSLHIYLQYYHFSPVSQTRKWNNLEHIYNNNFFIKKKKFFDKYSVLLDTI